MSARRQDTSLTIASKTILLQFVSKIISLIDIKHTNFEI